MKDLGMFLNTLIEKFDFKRLTVCVFIVLSLMLVPKINILGFLMPLNSADKVIRFIFALITTYIILSILLFLLKRIKYYFQFKPKKLFRMMIKYGDCINIFYSHDIKEYSERCICLNHYNISPDIVNKLKENNIIESGHYDYYSNSYNYRLTQKARKKLTRIKKIVVFIDSKIIKRNK